MLSFNVIFVIIVCIEILTIMLPVSSSWILTEKLMAVQWLAAFRFSRSSGNLENTSVV